MSCQNTMNSKIAQAVRLKTHPVAVYRAASCPDGALQFREGVWGCVIAMLDAASKGRTAAFSQRNVVCKGGQSGLGLKPFELGDIEYFLSVGGKGPRPGERYKQTPELARDYIKGLPECHSPDHVVFQPLEQAADGRPETVVFLVNPDQLSGLATLANYDRPTQDNVQLLFGAGCAQSILYGLAASEQRRDTCYIGLTDPSARKCIDKDVLSFTIPYHRYLEMEANVEASFLSTPAWSKLAARIV